MVKKYVNSTMFHQVVFTNKHCFLNGDIDGTRKTNTNLDTKLRQCRLAEPPSSFRVQIGVSEETHIGEFAGQSLS
jgi:hypothetical protein